MENENSEHLYVASKVKEVLILVNESPLLQAKSILEIAIRELEQYSHISLPKEWIK